MLMIVEHFANVELDFLLRRTQLLMQVECRIVGKQFSTSDAKFML